MSGRGGGGTPNSYADKAGVVFSLVAAGTLAYSVYAMHEILFARPREERRQKQAALSDKLGRPMAALDDLNEHEMTISQDVVKSSDIDVSFHDIGGMTSQLDDVYDNVILPVRHWKTIKDSGQKLTCPSGVLLYGKPGTGKTMSAKAIAKESGATFIGIKASTILNKWVGESEKLITALFSLARKLAPTVIFIDEVDTLLKNRNGDSGPTSLSASLGAFMAEWDGLQSVSDAPVVVVGATNRPEDVDPAFRRRMPLTVHTLPPDHKGRADILRINLRSEPIAEDFDYDAIAEATDGFTGAEIKELCRLVTLERLKAALGRGEANTDASVNASGGYRPAGASNTVNASALRKPLRTEDFASALNKMNSARQTVAAFKVEKQATLGDLINMLSSQKPVDEEQS